MPAVEIDTRECWEVLRGARVGRLLYIDDALPMVRPVRFSVQGSTILFSVEPRVAAKILRGGEGFATFQVDDLPPGTMNGRSVVVHGMARLVARDESDRASGLRLPGYNGDGVFACLVPERLDGRCVDLGV